MEDDVKPILDDLGSPVNYGQSSPLSSVSSSSTITTSSAMDKRMAELLETSSFNCRSCGKFFTTRVFAVHGRGIVCETCCTTNKWKGGRLEIYDVMLKDLQVEPCPNAGEGCTIQVLPETFPLHLMDCRYRPIMCLAPGCCWQNKQDDFTLHFLDKHRQDVINDGTTMDLALESFVIVKFFIRNNSKYFLIIKRPLGFCEVFYKILSVNDRNSYGATIKHFCDDSDTYTVQIDTQELNAIDKEYGWKKVNLLVLKMMFEGRSTLSVSVKVSHLSKIEEKLRCFGCRVTMRPPIYQCEGGHGICSTCSSTLQKCAICLKGLNKTRHTFLEGLTSNVLYNCSHQHIGCKSTVPGDKIDQHESTCRHRLYSCLWPKCGYKNRYELFKQHIVDLHKKKNTLAPHRLASQIPDGPANEIRSYIYIDDCLFELKFKVARANPSEWEVRGTVQLLNKELCKSKYLCKFAISNGQNEESSGNFLLAKDKSFTVPFLHRFRKDGLKRSLYFELTRSNL